jgi:hypothetical protein
LGGDLAEPAGLVVSDGLGDLLPGVHHERPVVHYRLTDWASAEHEHLKVGVVAILSGISGDTNSVAGSEHSQLPGVDGPVLGADVTSPGQHVAQRWQDIQQLLAASFDVITTVTSSTWNPSTTL